MEIAVLSGKGGTGKTTVSTNLATMMKATYVDCDVEEPNGFIFLKPEITETTEVTMPVPVIDVDKCNHCKACVDICQFNALMHVDHVMLFEKLCHGCGACMAICQTMAIAEEERPIGIMHRGTYGEGITCLSGTLNLTEPMAGPIISQLKAKIGQGISIIDCSPGTSCNVVKALLDVDYAILVTEPTAFGLHDLKLAIDLVKQMNIPFGIIINRLHVRNNMVSLYCEDKGFTMLGEIPYDRQIAEMYSNGELLVGHSDYMTMFQDIASRVKEAIACNSSL